MVAPGSMHRAGKRKESLAQSAPRQESGVPARSWSAGYNTGGVSRARQRNVSARLHLLGIAGDKVWSRGGSVEWLLRAKFFVEE
jgi:hypothetical protein